MSAVPEFLRRAVLPLACLLVAGGLVAAGSIAAGGDVVATKKAKVKIKCPNEAGKTVTCKVKGKLPRGKKGPQGEQGPAGTPGTPGTDGISGYEIVRETFQDVFAQNSGGFRGLSAVQTVACPAGKRAIGGGMDLGTDATQNGQQRQMILSASHPTSTGDGWSVQLFNNSTSIDSSIDLEVYAICATAG